MDYFGGIHRDREGCRRLTVVDGSDRKVAELSLWSTFQLSEVAPAICSLRAILWIDNGNRDEVVEWLLQCGARLVPISNARLRLYSYLRGDAYNNQARWLAHLCWLNPNIAGRLYDGSARSIPGRMQMRAESVTAWL